MLQAELWAGQRVLAPGCLRPGQLQCHGQCHPRNSTLHPCGKLCGGSACRRGDHRCSLVLPSFAHALVHAGPGPLCTCKAHFCWSAAAKHQMCWSSSLPDNADCLLSQALLAHTGSVYGTTVKAADAGLSVIASQQARAVLCVEINPAAESAFRASLARLASRADMQASASVNSNNNKDPRLLYESLPSSSSPSGWQGVGFRTADVCQQPGQWIQGSDVVIVDPPRKGLGAELLAALCRPRDQTMQRLARHGGQASPMQSGQAPSQKDIRKTRADKHGLQAIAPHQRPAQRLVYLSCGLPALIRDLEVLVKSGRWQVVHAQGYLFFPGTDSIETLVVLDHVDGQAGVC